MKRCGKCGEYKSSEEFSWRSKARGTRNSYCYPCQRDFCKEHYARNKPRHNRRRLGNNWKYIARNREYITAYLKEHPCIDCGESDPIILEFDHVGGDKEAELSVLVRSGCRLHRIQAEILKCVVRCANCHRRKTAKQFNWYKTK